MRMCVAACTYVYYVHMPIPSEDKEAADPLKLQLQLVVNYLMRVLGTEPKNTF